MRSLEDQLAAYAAYHRDARNIATHFIGIPLIVVSLLALLSRPAWGAGGLPFSPACAVVIVAALYYLRLSLRLGVMMLALLLLCLGFGAWVASLSTAAWLSIGIGGFVIGWLFQFVGHFWEGRKPAFMDDVTGLIIGPLFVLAEACFLAGGLRELARNIELRVGKVRNEKR
ncbi:Mpo1 family 2-hydroxy fatty acid dioxygenase [Serratia marcescens]|uniref:Mpo1 family 2-hydroxy fatty acid dioxygenase n=1 Tax=Serratia marcescens TaxID=615 RepID=UPI0040455D0B